ncbi:MAG: hypothetical protein IJV68_06155, partial [Clostridia bacterium]|nr:hypothetical protein [Clostridia bacterium]
MNERLLEPLKYYETEGRATHEQNINAYFDNLVTKSGINVEANRTIVKEYNKENETISKIESKISKYKALRVLSIIAIVIGAILFIVGITQVSASTGLGIGLILGGIALIVLCILAIVKKINPILKQTNELLDFHRKKANELLSEAERQMAPLNALF